jgi:hypothetical protein
MRTLRKSVDYTKREASPSSNEGVIHSEPASWRLSQQFASLPVGLGHGALAVEAGHVERDEHDRVAGRAGPD